MTARDANVVVLEPVRKASLDTILDVAQRRPIFPCNADKKPLTPRGFHDATAHTPTIIQWWERFPNALVAVPTGKPSGLLVVDIDGPDGEQWLAQNQHRIPTTQTHITRRGKHLIFGLSPKFGVRCSAGKIASGVDVRANGGYIVWWPAHGFGIEHEDEVAETPEWLLDLLRAPDKSAEFDPLLAPRRTEHTLQDAEQLLRQLDPNMGHDSWLQVGQALHHQFGDDAFDLWNRWSAGSKTKYPGTDALTKRWRSFKSDRLTSPVTFRSVLDMAKRSADAGSGIPILEVSNFLTRPHPRWRIKGLLPETGLAVIFGASGSGKTFFALDAASAIVRGDAWRGRLVHKGRVVYVAAEGVAGFRNRCDGLTREGHDLSGLYVVPASPPLTTEEHADAYIEAIQRIGGAEVVFIDTLSQVTPGVEENTDRMKTVLRAGQRVSEAFRCLVVFLGHSGKDPTKGLRGWSGVRAALDTEIEITAEGSTRVATITKQKDGEDNGRFAFRLRPIVLGSDEDGEPITTCVVEHEGHFVQPRKPVTGRTAKLVLETVRDALALGTGSVPVSTVIDDVIERMTYDPKSGTRDNRRRDARRALDTLHDNGWVGIENGEVTLS